jgi:hypothetical protein
MTFGFMEVILSLASRRVVKTSPELVKLCNLKRRKVGFKLPLLRSVGVKSCQVLRNPHIELVKLTFVEPLCLRISDDPLVEVLVGIALNLDADSG